MTGQLPLVQITGSLILAAEVPRAFDDGDYSVLVAGYGVMRVGRAPAPIG